MPAFNKANYRDPIIFLLENQFNIIMYISL